MANAQKFKVGQEVKIVRALGADNNFFHGGSIDSLRLNSHGKVLAVYDGYVSLDVQRGEAWYFHPDEIKTLSYSIQSLPGIERLERHPLFEMSAATPLIVVGGKVYAQGEKVSEENKPVTFLVDERKNISALEEIGTTESFDEMYIDRNEPELVKLQNEYAKEIWDELDLETKIGENQADIPTAIAAQIFPYLRDEKYQEKISGILGVQVDEETRAARPRALRNNSTLESLTNKIVREIGGIKSDLYSETLKDEEVIDRTPEQRKLDALLGVDKVKREEVASQDFRNRDFMISEGQVQYLYQAKRKSKNSVQINGIVYKVGDTSESVAQAESNQQRLFSQEIKRKALETHFTREQVLAELDTRIGDSARFAGLHNYDGGEFGFTKKGSSYYIWLKVPRFAIKSPFNGKCYLFGELKVGKEVGISGGRVYATGDVVMVKNNRHPLTNTNRNFAHICFGGNDIPAGRYGKDIAITLRKAREIAMKGYKGKRISLFAHRQLGKCKYCAGGVNHYKDKIVSERELTKKGIPIFDGLVKNEDY
ncbi:MAG: hypothetical protein WCI72_00890 [archaeon]